MKVIGPSFIPVVVTGMIHFPTEEEVREVCLVGDEEIMFHYDVICRIMRNVREGWADVDLYINMDGDISGPAGQCRFELWLNFAFPKDGEHYKIEDEGQEPETWALPAHWFSFETYSEGRHGSRS